MKYKIVLEQNDEGGYTAYAPALPGVIAEGETLIDALKSVREAIDQYIATTGDDWEADEDALIVEQDG